jgi:alpha-tubulin suppressor-like RCC1 family protein
MNKRNYNPTIKFKFITLLLILVVRFALLGNAQCVVSLAHKNGHSLALKNDSTLWSWGINTFGFLGLGNTIHQFAPTQIDAAAKWTTISVGLESSFAIKADSTLWAWGTANFSRLGVTAIGTYISSPKQVGSDKTWASVVAGGKHGLALKTDSTLWAWGANQFAEVSDGTTTSRSTPVLINSDKDWKQIVAGNNDAYMSMGIKNNGTLWGWGKGFFGDTTIQYNMPFTVPTQIGKDSNWQKIIIGWEVCLALKTDSSLWTWGAGNTLGALGDSGLAYRLWPKHIMPGYKFIDIAALQTSIAVRADGKVLGCGRNREGQLGLGDTIDRFTFTETGYTGTVKQIQSGSSVIILDSNDVLWAAGGNTYGSIGDGTTINRKTFVPVKNDMCIPLSTDAVHEPASKLSVYPNPTQHVLWVTCISNRDAYKIVNPLGVVVASGTISVIANKIDVHSLPAGIYFLQCNHQVCRFIKE